MCPEPGFREAEVSLYEECHGAEADCLPGRLAGLEDRETGATRSCAAKGAGHRSQAVCGVRGCGAG